MLNVKIVSVGSVKSKEIASLVDDYMKRLRPFARVEVVEVPHEPFRSDSDKEKAQKNEATRIAKQLRGISVFLEERGTNFSSEDFAKWLGKLGERGDVITFVIGGALGLHPSLTKGALKLSLSPLTFPHELARLILCEQLYRTSCIMSGKQYHY